MSTEKTTAIETQYIRISVLPPDTIKSEINQNELLVQVKNNCLIIYWSNHQQIAKEALTEENSKEIIPHLPSVGETSQDVALIKMITTKCQFKSLEKTKNFALMPKSYEEKFWHFDPQTKANRVSDEDIYKLVEATDKDKYKTLQFYEHHPVPGYEIASVQVIYNPNMNHKFALHLVELQQHDNNPAFKAKWPTGQENKYDSVEHPEKVVWRTKVHQHFKDLAKPYQDSDYPAVNLLPMWHGTKAEVVDSICRTGYANLAITDSGFFGKGIYGAHEAEYSYRVYAKQGGALILNWTATFSAYPVIDGDMKKFVMRNSEGREVSTGNYSNYDAHFAPVLPANPMNPNETVYYPTKPNQLHTYTELVVFQKAACLPRYLVMLQSTLLKSPQVNPYQSIFAKPTNIQERQSVVKKEYSFNETEWIVSVLNTKERDFGGHSVILVEGLRNGSLFIGRYDVFAAIQAPSDDENPPSVLYATNAKGYISQVRIEETTSYDRITFTICLVSSEKDVQPSNIPINTIVLQKTNAQITAYWLEGSTKKQQLVDIEKIKEKNKLKFPEIGQSPVLMKPFYYQSLIKEVILLCNYQHPDGAAFYAGCPSKSFKKSVTKVEKMIQSIKEDKALIEQANKGEIPPILFQYRGSENAHGLLQWLSQPNAGINCAEWCIQKLAKADIVLDAKPTPNYLVGSGCRLL